MMNYLCKKIIYLKFWQSLIKEYSGSLPQDTKTINRAVIKEKKEFFADRF